MVKASKYIEILLVLLTFSLIAILPQINVSGYVQSTITSKFICFLYGCLILLGIFMILVSLSKKIDFSISKLDIALFTVVFYITLNRYFIQPHFGFSIRYMELLGLSFLYVVLRRISINNCYWLLLAIVISGICQAVYGNLQLLGYYASNHSGFKMTGSFFNPGPYAGFLVSVWSVSLELYLFKDKIIPQVQSQSKKNSLFLKKCIGLVFEYIPLLGLVSITIILPATQSRAAWLGAIVSSLTLLELRYCILKEFLKKTKPIKKTFLIIASIVFLCAGLFGLYNFKKDSSDGRSFIWKVTTEMIVDSPVFGVGFDGFETHYMNYQAHYFANNGETPEAILASNTSYAFNEWLEFISENGLFGFVFLIIVVLLVFKIKTNTDYRFELLIAKTGLLAIGIFACFSYPMQILPIKLVLTFLLAMLSNSDTHVYQFTNGENNKSLWAFKAIVLLIGFVYMLKTIPYVKNLDHGFKTWESALSRHQYGDYKEAIGEYESVCVDFKREGDFLMNYGKTLTMAGEYTKAIVVLEQAKPYLSNTVIATTLGDSYKATQQYNKAELAYQQAINMVPSKFYANYLLAKLYDDSGQGRKAVKMALKILNKEIKIPSTAIKEMQEEMKKILIKYKKNQGF